MLESVSFSGITNLDPSDEGFVRDVVAETDAARYVTGGAWGVDTVCALAALELHPEADHLVIFPYGHEWNGDLLEIPGLRFRECFGGYMIRNDALVAASPVLVAFPKTPHEIQRSGTWSTVRRARTAGLEIQLHPLHRT